jgi:glyoxylase-like metal-dependent hydrolase (beta-lactamase superfamily II)
MPKLFPWIVPVALLAVPQVTPAQGVGATHDLTLLVDGVYAVGGRFQGANAAIIITDRDVVIVDSHGTPASAAALLEDVRRLTDKPVRYVINTHWHIDHHTGNQAYYQAYPDQVEFVAHQFTREDIPTLGRDQLAQVRSFMENPLTEAREQLASGVDDHGRPLTDEQRAQLERFAEGQEAFLAGADTFEFVLPSMTFEQRLVLHRDDRPIEVRYYFRGHTRGDVVVYLPEERILVAGDLLTMPILWSWASYPADYVKTLRAIEQLDIGHIVIGHGPVLEGTAYLVQVREFLESVVRHVRSAVVDGSSLAEVQASSKTDQTIQAFRLRFVEDTEEGNGMFDQMVGWTVERAFLEASGELE